MTRESYIEAIINMLKNCEKESTLEFIYKLLRKTV